MAVVHNTGFNSSAGFGCAYQPNQSDSCGCDFASFIMTSCAFIKLLITSDFLIFLYTDCFMSFRLFYKVVVTVVWFKYLFIEHNCLKTEWVKSM